MIAEVAYEIDPWEVILPELIPIHGRLENWAAWSRGVGRNGKCGSLEGRYASPIRWDSPAPRTLFDSRDALAISRGMLGMPVHARLLLHGWYILKATQRQMQRKLAIPFEGIPEELNRARHMIENRVRILTCHGS